MDDRERNTLWHGLRDVGALKLVGTIVTIVMFTASSTWAVALKYAAQANPEVVAKAVADIAIIRDSVRIIAEDSYDTNARQDGELTRFSDLLERFDQRNDTLLLTVRELSRVFQRFLCREDGNSVAYCERAVR